MNANVQGVTCAVTGANGFVGGRLKAYLQNQGCRVVEWSRRPGPLTDHVPFRLGQEVRAQDFAGTSALIHCAYDFSARTAAEIAASNTRGSEKLLRAAHAAGVEHMIFISSLSAFAGCRSRYGRAKLEIEAIALSLGATVIRPGLVYGDQPGGVFGGLVNQVRRARLIPLLGGGHQPQYLVHTDDLGHLIGRCLSGEIGRVPQPITLAHAEGWPMRELLTSIGHALNRQVRLVPVPWRVAWLGLKTLETLHLPAPFRSDSLLGYVFQNPKPDFASARLLKAECRRFEIRPAMLG